MWDYLNVCLLYFFCTRWKSLYSGFLIRNRPSPTFFFFFNPKHVRKSGQRSWFRKVGWSEFTFHRQGRREAEMASETTVWWTDCAMTECWGGGEGVRPDTQPDNQKHFCLHPSSTCLCASADPHRTTIVLLLFAWTVRTVTVSAVQPCWWRDKWSEVKDGHHITFTPPLFSPHVLLNLLSEAIFTQVTAPALGARACTLWKLGERDL